MGHAQGPPPPSADRLATDILGALDPDQNAKCGRVPPRDVEIRYRRARHNQHERDEQMGLYGQARLTNVAIPLRSKKSEKTRQVLDMTGMIWLRRPTAPEN